ncbi:MAG: TlpA family protein disulfide reductase [Bacteroidales bacterium]|nr:TlpA family protein disulfide reductase [Bacteroidales bacterium]
MKILLTIILFLGMTMTGHSQNVTISGELSGKVAPMISEIQFFHDGKMTPVKLDSASKTFSVQLTLKKPQFAEVKAGGNNPFFIFLIPGEELILNIEKPNYNDYQYQMQNEKLEKLNLVMQRFYSSLKEESFSTQSMNWQKELIGQKDIVSKALDEARKALDEQMPFIKGFAPDFPTAFNLFAESFMKYVSLEDYSLAEIETILEAMSASGMDITALTIPVFRHYLVDLSNVYAARKMESYGLEVDFMKQGHIPKLIATEAIVKYIPNQSVINFLLFDKINSELLVNGVKNRKYIDFLMENAGKVITDKFREKYELLLANAEAGESGERSPAMNFEFTDPEGKVYRLEDFRGKMVLIDFWASWCAPCKAQMPHLKELEKHYEGKDIVIAKVSLDASKAAWLKAIDSEGHKGVLLHAEGDFKNPFPRAYGISSIPRFMLIDAEGKIIDDDLPKPQFKKEVMAIIDRELFNKELNQILAKHFEALGTEVLMSGKSLRFKGKQSIPGIEIEVETNYIFPRNLRFDFKPVSSPTYELMLGEDFFKSKYMVVRNDTSFGNLSNLAESAKSWQSKMNGFELFLAVKNDGATVSYAEENATNQEMFVLQAVFDDNTVRFFIDRKDYLIKKMIATSMANLRSGGGIINAEVKYDDYRNVNGVMIPHDINMNNIITLKISEAEVGPPDPQKFQPAEMK